MSRLMILGRDGCCRRRIDGGEIHEEVGRCRIKGTQEVLVLLATPESSEIVGWPVEAFQRAFVSIVRVSDVTAVIAGIFGDQPTIVWSQARAGYVLGAGITDRREDAEQMTIAEAIRRFDAPMNPRLHHLERP